MSAKTFMLAHGEKLAVGAVAGACALVVWGAASDESIRPKDNEQQIAAINAKIGLGFTKNEPPVMKEPRPYLDQLLGRLSEQAPVSPVMAWLTTPPDKGKNEGGQGGGFYYIYELLAPSMTIADAVGTLDIGVQLPVPASQSPGRRISSEASRRWERNDKGPIVNTGRHLGLELQIRIGDSEWKPLVMPGTGKDGVMPLETAVRNAQRTIPTPEPWQIHQVRARIVAAVTALDLTVPVPERPKASVLVVAGQASEGPTKDEIVLSTAAREVKAKDGAFFKTLLHPVEGPLPASAKLGPNERIFVGPWSPVAKVPATASVRFALTGLGSEALAEDPTKSRDVGRFLLLRLFSKGTERKWMAKPLELKLGEGDVLEAKGVEMTDPFGTSKIKTDLLTPFEVAKLVKDQKRIVYWSVRAKSRAGCGKDRDIEIEKKEVSTDVVVLKNPESGSEVKLTKLITITPPAKADVFIYPHRAAAYSERDEFAKAPSEFRQWGLEPEQPKTFAPETGPLAALYQARKDEGQLDAENYRTDTPYVVMPDNRVIWWDVVEHKLKLVDPDGIMTAKAVAPPAQPAQPAPPVGGEMPGDGKPAPLPTPALPAPGKKP